MKLSFPWRKGLPVDELGQATADLCPQIERKVIKDVSVGTSETAIAHGLAAAPQAVFWSQHSNVTVWRSAAPDSKFVYLTASTACVVDLEAVL